MDECRIEGCQRPIKIKKFALCGMHYQRQWLHGDPLAWRRKPAQVCTVEGCEHKRSSHGLCATHAYRMREWGTTEKVEPPTICAVEACDRPVVAWAMCERHYRRALKGRDSERRCRFCGAVIDVNDHAKKVFCSKSCRDQERLSRQREDNRLGHLKRTFGITPEQFEEMLHRQGRKCAICGGVWQEATRNWTVDHDHKTGKVRGILCQNCNAGIGMLGDDPATLRAALRYLKV